MPPLVTRAYRKGSAKFAYQLSRLSYRRCLPQLQPTEQSLVNQLNQTGVAVTPIDRLDLPLNPMMGYQAAQLCAQLAARPTMPTDASQQRSCLSHTTAASPLDIANRFPAVFSWGFQPSLMRIADAYLQVPACCTAYSFRRDFAAAQTFSQAQIGTRYWHYDGEDHRLLRMIVYLHDVDSSGGPFEYLEPAASPPYAQFAAIDYKVTDAMLEPLVPRSRWQTCTGKAGTLILADLARVFHHGTIPQRDRFAMFYSFVSRWPTQKESCRRALRADRLDVLKQALPPHLHYRLGCTYF